MRTHEEFSEDCAAYVLGALDEAEAVALREHLESCTACRAEVARLSAVAEALGRGVPHVAAPPELRRRILDVVEGEAALFAAAGAPRERRRPRRRLSLRPAYALAAACAVALGIVLGAVVIAPGGSSTRVITASVAPPSRWGSARAPVAALRESGGSAELVVSGMPAAPRGKIYEVWVVRGARPHPTDALFNASSAGHATVAVPASLRGASAVLVTAERLGGASVPTMAPLISARLG